MIEMRFYPAFVVKNRVITLCHQLLFPHPSQILEGLTSLVSNPFLSNGGERRKRENWGQTLPTPGIVAYPVVREGM